MSFNGIKNKLDSPNKDSVNLKNQYNIDLYECLPVQFVNAIADINENEKKPCNKIIHRNKYFEFTYSITNKTLSICNKGIVYSRINGDTCKAYIMKAAIDTLIDYEKVLETFWSYQNVIKEYIRRALIQVYYCNGSHKCVTKQEVNYEFKKIIKNPLMLINVVGRIYQHRATGTLTASLASKFLLDYFIKTGIAQFIFTFINYIIELTDKFGSDVPIFYLEHHMDTNQNKTSEEYNFLVDKTKSSYEYSSNPILNEIIKINDVQEQNKSLVLKQSSSWLEENDWIVNVPSMDHKIANQSFYARPVNKASNIINVVSDIHANKMVNAFPINNNSFNVIAGDFIDDPIGSDIKGVAVIGKHEILTTINWHDKKWKQFNNEPWFKLLKESPWDAWSQLPHNNTPFFKLVKQELATLFPNLKILNNEATIYEGIRYIGLTLPQRYYFKKRAVQKYIYKQLKRIVGSNYQIPTVIITHAPLFNELSALRPTSRAYIHNYTCVNNELIKLFKQMNLLGVVHGYHHIPMNEHATKFVKIASRKVFVVCSIYNADNTGIELQSYIDDAIKFNSKNNKQKQTKQ